MRSDRGRPTPWTGGIVTALMGLAALSAYVWPLGFTLFVPLAGLLSLPFLKPERPPAAAFALAGLTALAVAAVAWSPHFQGFGGFDSYDEIERQTWLKLPLQLALYGALVAAAGRLAVRATARSARVFAWAAVALSVVLLLEAMSGAQLYQQLRAAIDDPIRPDLARRNVAQAAYALALMYWPAALLLSRAGHRRAAVVLGVGTFVSPLLLSAMAPPAALVASGIVFLLVRRSPVRATLATGLILAAVTLATPWLLLAFAPILENLAPSLGASWAARLDIWLFAAEHIAQRPLTGWGLDASRTFGDAILLHPHNAPLQLWLELGVGGALLAAGFWALLLRRIARGHTSDDMAAQAAAAATVYFVIGALSFGVWQEWWLALGALTAVWVGLAARAPDPFEETEIEA